MDAAASSPEDSPTTDPSPDTAEACRDPTDPVTFHFADELALALGQTDVSKTCQVEAVESTIVGTVMIFGCDGMDQLESMWIETDGGIALPLAKNDAITIRVVLARSGRTIGKYVRVDKPGLGHVFTVIDGETLTPVGIEFPLPIFASEPVVECPGAVATCGLRHRLGLAVQSREGGTSRVVFEGEHVTLREVSLALWIDEAVRYTEVECEDLSPSWFRILIATTSS